jgi:UDP-N-acetylglucosamine 2-epimerase (non-hydrolysing)
MSLFWRILLLPFLKEFSAKLIEKLYITSMTRKISCIFGTRPEAIKLAPVVLALRSHPEYECRVCVTAQHREMLDQVLKVFGIKPDVDLNLMQPNQSLAEFTSRAIRKLDDYMRMDRPDIVLLQGDTTTVLCAALAAFYNRIPVGHVEAGLRTGNLYSPWPEEANRVLTSHLAALHFAPTETNRQNLLLENIPSEKIVVTGNTVIDSLFMILEKINLNPPVIEELPDYLQPGCKDGPRIVLITGHRRENFGQGFENICKAVEELAFRFPDVHFVYPVHLNPRVREPVNHVLRRSSLANIHIIEPLDYTRFVAMLNRAYIILTDSGGVQEEAPSLGKPVLVLRDTTERHEAVDSGTVKLVGTELNTIVSTLTELVTNEDKYKSMSRAHNPYGDGKATKYILDVLSRWK